MTKTQLITQIIKIFREIGPYISHRDLTSILSQLKWDRRQLRRLDEKEAKEKEEKEI